MKYAFVFLSGLLLVGCAATDLSDLSSSRKSAPKVAVTKPFSANPATVALAVQLEHSYAGAQVQVFRVGNEIKVTYPADELFGVGGVELLPSALVLLDPFINAVKIYPEAKLRVDSFTDNSGIRANNVARSEDRAQNVARYLVENGLPAGKMTLKGYGSDYYIADNETPEGRAQNRRVVLTISPPYTIPSPQKAESVSNSPSLQPEV